MDNPQGTLVSEAEKGWLAGIIDGEGCVTLFFGVRRSGKMNNVSPQIIVGNTDKALIDRYADILGRLGVGVYVTQRKPQYRTGIDGAMPKKSKYKDLYVASTTGFLRCKKLLEVIADSLITDKRVRAFLILELINQRLDSCVKNGKFSNTPYTVEDMRLIWRISELISTKHSSAIKGLLRDLERSPG